MLTHDARARRRAPAAIEYPRPPAVSARSPEKSSPRILVTGGAGFVGSTIAIALAARHPDWAIVALDNLKRRGSELNLPRLRNAGVSFVHGP